MLARVFFCILFQAIGFAVLLCQPYKPDSLVAKNAEAFAKDIYFRERDKNLSVYNGPRANVYSGSINGFAYYDSKGFQPGSVLYEGIWYHDLPLRYDLVADELIVAQKDLEGIPSILFKQRVSEFHLSGAGFVRLERGHGIPGEGYYQSILTGDLSFYIKRKKIIVETIADTYRLASLDRDFQERDEYYVRKGDSYHLIRRKNDLMDLAREKRKQLARVLKEKKLVFRKNPELFIQTVCAYYNNQLND